MLRLPETMPSTLRLRALAARETLPEIVAPPGITESLPAARIACGSASITTAPRRTRPVHVRSHSTISLHAASTKLAVRSANTLLPGMRNGSRRGKLLMLIERPAACRREPRIGNCLPAAEAIAGLRGSNRHRPAKGRRVSQLLPRRRTEPSYMRSELPVSCRHRATPDAGVAIRARKVSAEPAEAVVSIASMEPETKSKSTSPPRMEQLKRG